MQDETAYTIMLAKIRAHRQTREVIGESLKQFDVTINDWLTLGAIKKYEGNVSGNDLAVELQVSLPLVSRITKRLEETRYVTVEKRVSDKRNRVINLTESGDQLLADSEPVVREALKKWLAPINREHIDIYITVLLQVAYKL